MRPALIAVPPDRDDEPVQSFRTFTTDLQRLADWLVACRVTSVALESTGVFWIPVYEILEARGLAVHLVNARHVRNLPGRKSDVSDAEWLRDLHSVGLLRASFRPTAAIVTLRTYLRHRQTLVSSPRCTSNGCRRRWCQMNLQLPFVISDITGQTGLQIIRATVAGERDPTQLARFRHGRCRATAAEITAALTGHYRPELLFALQQNLELYDACQRQIDGCDRAIEVHVRELTASIAAPGPLPAARAARQRIEPAFDVRSVLHHLTGGVDLTQINGIGAYTALKLIAEIGTDMRRWPSAQHFGTALNGRSGQRRCLPGWRHSRCNKRQPAEPGDSPGPP
jgi:transposase